MKIFKWVNINADREALTASMKLPKLQINDK